jgi:uncharacterized protein YceH (UPF0502 family)
MRRARAPPCLPGKPGWRRPGPTLSLPCSPVEPDAAEIRVLGCLIEKQRTTPDIYPLTLNSLRLACNQSTNRDPVVEYDESTIRGALERLGRRNWTTLASWSNRRAMKYRHTLDSALGLSDPELALLCVLMLRGPQTPGELKQRTERLHGFADLAELEETLGSLIERELVARLPRRPGQREERYTQLLGGTTEPGAAVPEPAPSEPAGTAAQRAAAQPAATARLPTAAASEPAATSPQAAATAQEPAAPGWQPAATSPEPAATSSQPAASPAQPTPEPAPQPTDGLEWRVARLEDELASLRSDLRALREELGAE